MNDQENYSVSEFQPFPKMARLNREVIVTEKLDGTNAQILIVPKAELDYDATIIRADKPVPTAFVGDDVIFVGSRTRWIFPGKTSDNYGFAGWVKENAEELVKLGPGRHFGEYWGGGIQRGYGLKEKRFSLFNVGRWIPDAEVRSVEEWGKRIDRPGVLERVDEATGRPGPKCCFVVPTLWRGEFKDFNSHCAIDRLRVYGSVAAPGFMQPEGIVVFHTAAGTCFKATLEHDEKPKGLETAISSEQLAAGKPAADEVFRQKCEK